MIDFVDLGNNYYDILLYNMEIIKYYNFKSFLNMVKNGKNREKISKRPIRVPSWTPPGRVLGPPKF